jgi:hypothetical protein
MNRLLNLGFGVVVGTIGIGAAFAPVAQAFFQYDPTAPIVPTISVPVTGGNFSVDLNIQNGVVQNYGYTNNQLPTFLTPVGTINITGATLPNLGWADTRTTNEIMNPSGSNASSNPIAGVNLNNNSTSSVTAVLQITGSTQLNDGRSATFTNTNAFLFGSATASSPFPIESIGTATDPNVVPNNDPVFYPASVFRPLPNTYQGTIQMTIQTGSVMVPQSAFSNASQSETRLAIASGDVQYMLYSGSKQLQSRSSSGTQVWPEIFTFNLADQQLTNGVGEQLALSSPDGEMNLTIRNISQVIYPAGTPLITMNDGTKRLGYIMTGITNGNVTLTNGQRFNINDRLISFYTTDYNEERRVTIIGGGELFVDSTAIIPPLAPNPIAATEATSPIATTTASTPDPQLSILTDTTIANQAQTKPPIAPSLPNPQTVRAILDSPLSSSRIFPDMGAFR